VEMPLLGQGVGRGHALAATAVLACLAATLFQVLWVSPVDTRAAFRVTGDFLFRVVGTDVAGFAVPAAYFRLVVPACADEPLGTRALSAIVVGCAALGTLRLTDTSKAGDCGFLFGAISASYVFMSGFVSGVAAATAAACAVAVLVSLIFMHGFVGISARCATGLVTVHFANFLISRSPASHLVPPWSLGWFGVGGACFAVGMAQVPYLAFQVSRTLLPVDELTEAYLMVGEIVGHEKLNGLAWKLIIVTTFCQVGLGYAGVAMLRSSATRKNALISVGDGKMPATGFARLVGLYMITAALPYMLQRTVIENVNNHVFGVFQKDIERSLRLDSMFPMGAHGLGDNLLSAVQGSKLTVEAYTQDFNQLVTVVFSAVEAKLFALPKLMQLAVLMHQPRLVFTVLPASIALDVVRTRTVTSLTKIVEGFSREIVELQNRRAKVEQHDVKNEERIRRGASSAFARAQWLQLADEIDAKAFRYRALSSFRVFVNALYTTELLVPGMELVIAWLLQARQILNADIFLCQRVIEETIGLLLTRFRMDAKLASLKTSMDRLANLSTGLADAHARDRANCTVEGTSQSLRIESLEFVRGPTEVRIAGLALQLGRVYAVTGPNGCGKSSLFGILASCSQHATALPEGLEIRTMGRLAVPSDEIVEITQAFYCPLYVKPIAWILSHTHLDQLSTEELEQYELQIEQLAIDLDFFGKDQEASASISEANELLRATLHAEQDDWYDTLSGGQRAKVEVMRRVLLRGACPRILLIDEAFAPLDPVSKVLVYGKLKKFCAHSLVLVIYHADASEACVPGSDFFDEDLHFSNGAATLRATC